MTRDATRTPPGAEEPSLAKRWLRIGAVIAALVVVGGAFVAATGIVPIAASSGHWAITYWVLEFGKRRSVATHTLGLAMPDLDAQWLVLKGAGHYHDGCRPCHGAPDLARPRIAAAMTPEPPDLLGRVEIYEPDELFYIVKHGIKFTGMPAWPAQERDDEVRAVVAFLLELPRLDAEAYRELVHGEAPAQDPVTPLAGLVAPLEPPAEVVSSCGRCHGVMGQGRGTGAFPKLAGQKPEYLFRALRAYASSERNSGIMEPIAAGLSEAQWRELADYYAALPGDTAALEASAGVASIERGRAIATFGVPEKDLPSCADCHGPEGRRRNDAYPFIAGQYANYLVLQLEQFAAGHRGGSEYAHLMQHVAPRMSQDEIEAVAAYYAQAAGAL
jgi:cytochrome c553